MNSNIIFKRKGITVTDVGFNLPSVDVRYQYSGGLFWPSSIRIPRINWDAELKELEQWEKEEEMVGYRKFFARLKRRLL